MAIQDKTIPFPTQLSMAKEFDLFKSKLQTLSVALSSLRDKWYIMDNWDYVYSNMEVDPSVPSLIEKGKKKGMFEKYNKKWIAFHSAFALYRLLNRDMQRFLSAKDAIVGGIRPLYPELAKRLEIQLRLLPKEELEVLEPIANMLAKNPQLAISYIKAHYPEIMQKLEAFNDKKTKHEFRRIVLLISGEEINELNRIIGDVRLWGNYRLTNRIEFFAERLLLYVKGGRDPIGGAWYLGLASRFKDDELSRGMFAVPQVRKLWTYKQEMQFFSWARSVVTKALGTPKWEGFLGKNGFLWKLYKGPKYIKMVKEKFGNEEFADFLSRLNAKIHEDPTEWQKELGELGFRLSDTTYQNMYVITPAQQALINLFRERINHLIADRNNALKDLKSLLAKKIGELHRPKQSIRGKFLDILTKTRKKLIDELEGERLKFESLQREVVLPMDEFWLKYSEVMSIPDLRRESLGLREIMDTLGKWEEFAARKSEILMSDEDSFKDFNAIRKLTSLILAEDRIAKVAKAEIGLQHAVMEDYKHGILLINQMMRIIKEEISPGMEKLVSIMEPRLADYMPELATILNTANLSRMQNQTYDPQRIALRPAA